MLFYKPFRRMRLLLAAITILLSQRRILSFLRDNSPEPTLSCFRAVATDTCFSTQAIMQGLLEAFWMGIFRLLRSQLERSLGWNSGIAILKPVTKRRAHVVYKGGRCPFHRLEVTSIQML